VRAVAVLLAAGTLLLAGCGGGEEEAAAPPAQTSTTTTATPDRPAAPAIAGTSLEDEPLSLADFRGRPVLVNVWSSW
jgi:ABC-type glycerol-3-phosphate transport system substrate-binding protein